MGHLYNMRSDKTHDHNKEFQKNISGKRNWNFPWAQGLYQFHHCLEEHQFVGKVAKLGQFHQENVVLASKT